MVSKKTEKALMKYIKDFENRLRNGFMMIYLHGIVDGINDYKKEEKIIRKKKEAKE